MEDRRMIKRHGRYGEWGKLSRAYRKGANKRTRRQGKEVIRNETA